MSNRVANGPAIKAIRQSQKRRGSRFATDCVISHAYLSNIEAGRKQPSPEVLDRIAEQLGCGVDAISYVLPGCPACDEVAA